MSISLSITQISPFGKSKFNLYEAQNLTASTLLHRLVLSIELGTVQTGTGKVDPARKFKCGCPCHFCGVQLEVNRTKLKSKTLNSSKFLNLNIYIFRIVLQNNILQNIYYIYNNSLERKMCLWIYYGVLICTRCIVNRFTVLK